MFDPRIFVIPKAKPLPIVLMLDVSGSMGGTKIDTLNKAVKEMIKTFVDECEIEILISIVTFGKEVKKIFPFTPVQEIKFDDLEPGGLTPLGSACSKVKEIIENKEETPGCAYRPTIILVSDGAPTDSWKTPMKALIMEGRSSKCDRMAMAIGQDANREVLSQFIEGTQNSLFTANKASEIVKFFKFVTMSVMTRTKSKNPNVIPKMDIKINDQTVTANKGGEPVFSEESDEDDEYF